MIRCQVWAVMRCQVISLLQKGRSWHSCQVVIVCLFRGSLTESNYVCCRWLGNCRRSGQISSSYQRHRRAVLVGVLLLLVIRRRCGTSLWITTLLIFSHNKLISWLDHLQKIIKNTFFIQLKEARKSERIIQSNRVSNKCKSYHSLNDFWLKILNKVPE